MDIFLLTDILGIIAFSLSGFLVGVRNRLDLLGIVIAASLTALGGGIIRDALLHLHEPGHRPSATRVSLPHTEPRAGAGQGPPTPGSALPLENHQR